MPEYTCSKCGFMTNKKSTYDNHLSKKTSCDQNKTLEVNILTCSTCKKEFSIKGNLTKHIKNGCKKLKDMDDKLKKTEEDIIILKNEYAKMKDMSAAQTSVGDNNTINSVITNNTNNNNTTNNNTTNNNTTNNNTTNVNITLNYDGKNVGNLLWDEFLKILDARNRSTVKLTEAIHFNPDHPELHNVYIPSMKEKYAHIYENDNWILVRKNELVDRMYDDKLSYIISEYPRIKNLLNAQQRIAIERYIDADKEGSSIINEIKNDIELLMFNKRGMVIERRKKQNNNLSNE